MTSCRSGIGSEEISHLICFAFLDLEFNQFSDQAYLGEFRNSDLAKGLTAVAGERYSKSFQILSESPRILLTALFHSIFTSAVSKSFVGTRLIC